MTLSTSPEINAYYLDSEFGPRGVTVTHQSPGPTGTGCRGTWETHARLDGEKGSTSLVEVQTLQSDDYLPNDTERIHPAVMRAVKRLRTVDTWPEIDHWPMIERGLLCLARANVSNTLSNFLRTPANAPRTRSRTRLRSFECLGGTKTRSAASRISPWNITQTVTFATGYPTRRRRANPGLVRWPSKFSASSQNLRSQVSPTVTSSHPSVPTHSASSPPANNNTYRTSSSPPSSRSGLNSATSTTPNGPPKTAACKRKSVRSHT